MSFEERLHPRGGDGKFAKGAGGKLGDLKVTARKRNGQAVDATPGRPAAGKGFAGSAFADPNKQHTPGIEGRNTGPARTPATPIGPGSRVEHPELGPGTVRQLQTNTMGKANGYAAVVYDRTGETRAVDLARVKPAGKMDRTAMKPAYVADAKEGDRVSFDLPATGGGLETHEGRVASIDRVNDGRSPRIDMRLEGSDRVFKASPNLHAWVAKDGKDTATTAPKAAGDERVISRDGRGAPVRDTAAPAKGTLEAGDRIEHPEHGPGRVSKMLPSGDYGTATFDRSGTKKMFKLDEVRPAGAGSGASDQPAGRGRPSLAQENADRAKAYAGGPKNATAAEIAKADRVQVHRWDAQAGAWRPEGGPMDPASAMAMAGNGVKLRQEMRIEVVAPKGAAKGEDRRKR